MIVMAVTDDVERKFDMYPEWYRVVCWSIEFQDNIISAVDDAVLTYVHANQTGGRGFGAGGCAARLWCKGAAIWLARMCATKVGAHGRLGSMSMSSSPRGRVGCDCSQGCAPPRWERTGDLEGRQAPWFGWGVICKAPTLVAPT